MNNPAIPAMGKLDMRIWLDTGFCERKCAAACTANRSAHQHVILIEPRVYQTSMKR
jgi:hypothetical protein